VDAVDRHAQSVTVLHIVKVAAQEWHEMLQFCSAAARVAYNYIIYILHVVQDGAGALDAHAAQNLKSSDKT
jgi:hypothetical protein